MPIDSMIKNAKGDMWETALRGNQDGYVPPEVDKWIPQDRPADYLDEDEQPHFVAVSSQRALRVETNNGIDIQAESRVHLDKVQKGIMSDGQVGYLDSDEPYSNILFITNKKILLLVGKQNKTLAVEFEYSDDDFSKITTDNVIVADGLRYELDIQFTNEELSTFQYLDNHTSIIVDGIQPMKNVNEKISDLPQLKKLAAEDFEKYVANVWQGLGYSCKITKSSGDSGIDVVAEKGDKRVLIQAKKYTNSNVGVRTIQRSAGLLVDEQFRPSEVVIVTTSNFTKDAKNRAAQIDNLKLVNGPELVKISKSLPL